MSLTPQQAKFLNFIETFTRNNGYAPSQQEIAAHFGYSSLGTVQDYLKRLQQKGYLQKTWNGKRTIQVNQTTTQQPLLNPATTALPLMGRVAAGQPIEAVLDQESVDVPASMLRKPGQHFALEVRGDSMIEDGICDGDMVILRKQNTANNGDTVVALIDREATIKRLYRHSDRVELKPANSKYKPIVLNQEADFSIEGILVGLIRQIER